MDIEKLPEDKASFRKGEVSLKEYRIGVTAGGGIRLTSPSEEQKEALRQEHVLRLEAENLKLKERNKELYIEVLQYEKVCKLVTAEYHKKIDQHGIASVAFALLCLVIGYGLARF